MRRNDIAGRIDTLIRRSIPSLTNVDVAKAIGGVTKEAVRQWRSGITWPRLDKLEALATVLKTTEEYLLFGNRTTGGKESDMHLRDRLVQNDDELQLLRYFRGSNPHGKKAILETARAHQLANPQAANVHQLRKNHSRTK